VPGQYFQYLPVILANANSILYWHPSSSQYTSLPSGEKREIGKTATHAKNHGREPPHPAPPNTPAYYPPPAETATAGTTGAANATEDGRRGERECVY
jgi:hypothetical protein